MNSSSPFRDAIFLHLSDTLGEQFQAGPAAGLIQIRATKPVLIESAPWWKMARHIALSVRNQLEFQCGFDDLGHPLVHQYKRIWITELEVSRIGLYHVTRSVFDLS